MIRISIAQINPTVGDLKGNQEKILHFVKKAKQYDADLVVFPEMVICGYPPEDLLYKDHFVRDNIKVLKDTARQIRNITAIIGFVDQDKKKNLYNAAATISAGKIKDVYHKQNLPNYGVFDEKRYFTPGTKSPVFSICGIKVGVNICEDVWVNKGVCHTQVSKGAKLLINLSCSPFDVKKYKKREDLLQHRAKQLNKYICYANIVGGQDELVFDGGSLIINPKGETIVSGAQFEEECVICDLDIKGSTRERIPIGKRLARKLKRDERIYKALVLGTRDYIQKNGFQKVLIGLSGGIDSSVVAAVAVDAVGKENVIGVTMPSQFTSKGTKTDAYKLAKNLSIEIMEIPIKSTYDAYEKALAKVFKSTKSGLAEENIQARIRGNLLMALSNKFGWLVLTTGNKSEFAVGYCTLYGDMSGGFAVLKDVPKTQVYAIAEFINAAKEVIPHSVIKRPPTAELRNNQKDQDSLPPYDQLDEVLEKYVEKHMSMRNITKKKGKKDIDNVIGLIDRNEYKRRQSPPGIKITQRAFGKDWRLPITNKYKE